MKLPYHLRSVSLFTVGILSASIAYADQQVSVDLEQLKMIQAQEKRGDELFISVSEFPKNGTPRHYQVPSFPTHWLSQYLTNVKHVPLWQKQMKACEETKVVFSLVEQDFAPWNVDDLLGSVELSLTCENGKPVAHWIIPNSAITEKFQNKKDTFTFTGEKAKYEATFKLEHHSVPNKK